MCLGTCGESSDFLMPYMQPFDLPLAAYGVGEPVQAVAHDAVDSLNTGQCQSLGELVRDGGHIGSPDAVTRMD
jgi:hypothetical protein